MGGREGLDERVERMRRLAELVVGVDLHRAVLRRAARSIAVLGHRPERLLDPPHLPRQDTHARPHHAPGQAVVHQARDHPGPHARHDEYRT